MKLIIDIDKDIYKKCKWKNNGVVGLEWWEIAIANGTPILDNATNGDVIKAMFPNTEIMITDERVFLRDGTIVKIHPLIWWNAPYKKGGK